MSDEFDLEGLLQQAMAVQQQLAEAQEQARAAVVEGTSGGGLVRVTVTGGYDATAVHIAPEAVDPDDVSMLEDLVLAALRDALAKVQRSNVEAMGDIASGFGGGLGGLLGSG
jgi:nucleoid-associated protein EbfC